MIAATPNPAADGAAHLVATPANPVPPGAIVRRLRTPDGAVLRAARWEATRVWPNGTVAIFQGHAEFIEKYFEVIAELLDRGFAVAIFDWRGQGGSARELAETCKGHVDDFSLYRRDLLAFIDEIVRPFCPKPWFGLGHSMGGALLAAAAHDAVVPFERIVLDVPMLRITLGTAEPALKLMVRGLDLIGFGGAFPPGLARIARNFRPFEDNKLTSDPVRYARNEGVKLVAPHLGIGAPTIGWLSAAFRFCAAFNDPEYARETLMPSLVFSCTGDRVVDVRTIDRYASSLKAGWQIVIPHARHELLMERDVFREQFWAAFDAFIPGTRSELHALGRSNATAMQGAGFAR